MRRQFSIATLAIALWLAGTSAAIGDPLAGFNRQGSGEYRKFGFLIYEATLWTSAAANPLNPPYALGLTYKRALSGKQLAEASVSEIRKLKVTDETRLARWGEQLARVFPDVKPEDRIVGIHAPEGARFLHNGRVIGEINDPAFAAAFFGIWLHPNTSAPDLRAVLLQDPGS